MIEVTEATFEQEVLQADQPVLIDFWAAWCGPCKMLTPVLERVVQEFEGQLKVVKINVDDNGSISAKYGIRAIPTLVLIKNGDVVGTLVGLNSQPKIASWLMTNL